MSKWSLIAKIMCDLSEEYTPLQLKDETFLLYNDKEIIIFDKNLNSEKIISLDKDEYANITNVKQIKNGKILCCNNDLYIYTIKSKKILDTKILKMPKFMKKEKIFDIIELKDGRLIGLTNQSILHIKISNSKDENDEISQLYKIPKNWLINGENQHYFKQFLNIYELENKNLLIHSHSEGYIKRFLGRSHISKDYENKIFILDINNFKATNLLNDRIDEIKIIIFKNYICISYIEHIDIYSLNDYKLLNKVESYAGIALVTKYDENIIFLINDFYDHYDIIMYNISDVNNIKIQKFKNELSKFLIIRNAIMIRSGRSSLNKSITKLNNGQILLIHFGAIFLLKFQGLFDFNNKYNPDSPE